MKTILVLIVPLLLTACTHTAIDSSADSSEPARSAASISTTQPGDYQKLIDQGMGYYSSGDYIRAISQLETAFLLDKSGPQPWAKYVLYYCYLATGQYQTAKTIAADIVKEKPHEPMSYQQVGLAEYWSGRHQSAVDNFKKALEFETHSPIVNFYLALAMEKLDKMKERNQYFEKAESEYQQVLQQSPSELTATYELASLYGYWNKNLDKALSLLNAARESVTQNEETSEPAKKLYLGFYLPRLEAILLSKKGQVEESQKRLMEAITHAPSGIHGDLAEIFFYTGKNYLQKGDPQIADSFFNKALTLEPNTPYSGEIRKLLRPAASSKKPTPPTKAKRTARLSKSLGQALRRYH